MILQITITKLYSLSVLSDHEKQWAKLFLNSQIAKEGARPQVGVEDELTWAHSEV